MGIIVKTIRNKKYAYHSYRLGKRVVHKYIGPLSDGNVASRIENQKQENRVPEKFYQFFWDVDPKGLNTKTHSRYIIERILELGDMYTLRWIQRMYPAKTIMEVCETSRKVSPKSKNLWRIWYEDAQ